MNHSADHLAVSASEVRELRRLYADVVRQLEDGHSAATAQAGDMSQAYGGYEECTWAAGEVTKLRDDLHGIWRNVLIEDLKQMARQAGGSADTYDLAEDANRRTAGATLTSGLLEA